MRAVEVAKEEQQVLDAMRTSPELKSMFAALIKLANGGAIEKPREAIEKATDALPETKTARTITIEEMKQALRAADCLYDDKKHWNQLGAKNVPEIPDAVIREAYKKGGRVILHCSSISEKADALQKAGHPVCFYGNAKQSDYKRSVSKPQWIVIPSHIDKSTLGWPKSTVVTSEMPAPTPENLFSMSAYAILDGGRQPKGYKGLYAFTNQPGTVVAQHEDSIFVDRDDDNDCYRTFGAARFGPPRN